MQEVLILAKAIGEYKITEEKLLEFLLGRKNNTTFATKMNLDPYFGIFSHLEYNEIIKIIKKTEDSKLISRGQEISLTQYGQDCANAGKILVREKEKQRKNVMLKEETEDIMYHSKFLEGLNLDQKKAVVCTAPRILCVAGAGSGKTTVLTKRIVHLVQNKGISASKILAITFTRKAKEHMDLKLKSLGITDCRIYTFNSFGEYLIRRSGRGGTIVSSFKKKEIVERAILELGLDFGDILQSYFKDEEDRKNGRNKFVNDCFVIRDYYNNLHIPMEEFYKKFSDAEVGGSVYRIISFVNAYFRKNNLRDYSDQLVLGMELVRKGEFEHVLVDEYQDINSIQNKLIEKLGAENLFCVGDPRQSIYGWRGSKLEYIQNFSEGEVIYLTKNYRSCEAIVLLGNEVISEMELPDLESVKNGGSVSLTRYDTMKDEAISVAKKIKESKFSEEDIFVIARTNNTLRMVEEELDRVNVKYIVKNDDVNEELRTGAVSLLTGHCSKGLEAKEVFVVGCTTMLYPCVKSEHKLLEFVKEYYNKREEERRLLYVALTRAEEALHISYFGQRLSVFLKGKIKVQEEKSESSVVNEEMKAKLKEVRAAISEQVKVPEYLIMSEKEMEMISREEDVTFKVLKKILRSRANKFGDLIMERI